LFSEGYNVDSTAIAPTEKLIQAYHISAAWPSTVLALLLTKTFRGNHDNKPAEAHFAILTSLLHGYWDRLVLAKDGSFSFFVTTIYYYSFFFSL